MQVLDEVHGIASAHKRCTASKQGLLCGGEKTQATYPAHPIRL